MVLWQPYLNKYNIIGFVSYYQLLMVCVSRPRYFDNPTMKERKSMQKTKMVRNVDDGSWLQCACLMLELHSYWFKSTKTHFSVYGESQNGTNREGRNKKGGIPRSRWSIHGYNLTYPRTYKKRKQLVCRSVLDLVFSCQLRWWFVVGRSLCWLNWREGDEYSC